MADHPVKVPEDLVIQWWEEAVEAMPEYWPAYVADRAAQWGWDQREHEVQEQADQELEAIEHWLITGPYGASIAISAPTLVGDLHAAMRPKPPSLAEQGMAVVRQLKNLGSVVDLEGAETKQQLNVLEEALNRLAELEAQQ
jgi:hypothetical protein